LEKSIGTAGVLIVSSCSKKMVLPHAEKIKGRHRNAALCKIQYPMKNRDKSIRCILVLQALLLFYLSPCHQTSRPMLLARKKNVFQQ
jgi:hypothetical protein